MDSRRRQVTAAHGMGWSAMRSRVMYVISLDLRSNCLYGSINFISSLFRLVHLQRLDLSYNHFNYSPIPPHVRNLSRLTYLNLTASMFSGQIPFEISHLSHMTPLHLRHNLILIQ